MKVESPHAASASSAAPSARAGGRLHIHAFHALITGLRARRGEPRRRLDPQHKRFGTPSCPPSVAAEAHGYSGRAPRKEQAALKCAVVTSTAPDVVAALD